MNIVKYPTPSLLEKSLPVEINKELKDFIDQFLIFKENLDWGKVAGLAAPQVGHNIRVFIALDNIYINPEVIPTDDAVKRLCKEGCYSLEKNKFDYEVERWSKVRVKWLNKKGMQKDLIFTGIPAQVIQHEFDHLEGKLCCGDKI